jgi:aryl-alcohol dehydrogenase-like predicted oxidoreductase
MSSSDPSTVHRTLGADGPQVFPIGLGCMGMSGMYGPSDRAESIATIHAALDAGVTLLDTGDFYGMGHNELLIAEALEGRDRDAVQLSVKFGALRGPDGAWFGHETSPGFAKHSLAQSLSKLGTDHVDVYRAARLTEETPIEDVVGAIAEMVQAGYVRHIGLSEVGAETIRRAHAVHPIADLQIEYSLLSRGPEDDILPTCRELGIAVTAYGVLSRGLLSGHWTAESGSAEGDTRAMSPRFRKRHLPTNLALVDALAEVAADLGATTAQVAIAWALGRGEEIVPIVGARTRERLTETLGALDVTLDDAALARIEEAVPRDAASGARYPHAQMQHLDSETTAH